MAKRKYITPETQMVALYGSRPMALGDGSAKGYAYPGSYAPKRREPF